ncbi:hypothetical protein ACFPM3_04715 [Streptomyces coeruleoprunus]|uniref:Uncharacterized protein n=1 Tax=Streptomyces coeruleoprunus TaxID=285563 RepID=A0ABV9XB19_9ACTN
MASSIGRMRLRAPAVLALVLAVLLGTAAPGTADDQRPPGAADGIDLSRRFDNPLLSPPLLPVSELRVAMSLELPKGDEEEAFDPDRNGAVELINPLALTHEQIMKLLHETTTISLSGDKAWRTSIVTVASVEDYLNRRTLRSLDRARVERLVAVSALNIPGRRHSEGVIEDVLKKYAIGPRAKLLGASERQQCRKCAALYPKGTPTVYARKYDLSVKELAMESRAIAQARQETAGKSPEQQRKAVEKAARPYKDLREARNADAMKQLELDLEGVKRAARTTRGDVLGSLATTFAVPRVTCPPSKKPAPRALGAPAPHTLAYAAAVKAGDPCDQGRPLADRPATTGLGKALSAPGTAPGGIDFSTMELRYLADPGDGGGLRYAFSAGRDPMKGDARTATGLKAADQTSDAFFVWLSLDPGSFWVNLNPNEPDRIVDSRLGRTDAGRIMLQADLRMKKTVGQLVHPRTALGRRFWDGIAGNCLSFRTWIVSAPASVYADGDRLHILDAPLDVQMETQYLEKRGESKAASCPQQDKATEDHNEGLFRGLILPRLKHAINTAPAYAELRRVHLARVAAEWYRELSHTKDTAYGDLVDKGDITDWRTETGWKPRDTFDAYVDSYKKGEFEVTDRTRKGDTVHVRTYTYGGVDLTRIPLRKLTPDRFTAEHAGLARSVDRSLTAPSAATPDDPVWLGATTPGRSTDGARTPAPPSREQPPQARQPAAGSASVPLRLLPLLLVPLGLAVFLWWRRRGPRPMPARTVRYRDPWGP